MWLYDGIEISDESLDGYVGFVYMITNLTNQRKYIGKKLLKNRRTKIVKGKKKRTMIDSDWKVYWGSNKPLQEDVKSLGESNFTRQILRLCKSKGESNYWEAHYQFVNRVLFSDEWYNDHIWCRVHRSHVNKKVDNLDKPL